MSILQETAAARVLVVGKDPIITRTLSKLLELDERIHVLGEAPSIGTAPISELRPDVVIVDEDGQSVDTTAARNYISEVSPDSNVCALETLRDLTVSELLETVRRMAPPQSASQANRHLRVVATPEERDALASLSDRELQVVRLVAEGLSNKEISARLTLSDKTVKNHISHILAKMGLTARTQVAVYAIRAGFV
ncbi:MAG TPA: response regulator transcription factor [Candidatus Baltobacteraceae bacterium]|nr:response regulator transcription factor [Candidatus Baltobacteraceae bacterium]